MNCFYKALISMACVFALSGCLGFKDISELTPQEHLDKIDAQYQSINNHVTQIRQKVHEYKLTAAYLDTSVTSLDVAKRHNENYDRQKCCKKYNKNYYDNNGSYKYKNKEEQRYEEEQTYYQSQLERVNKLHEKMSDIYKDIMYCIRSIGRCHERIDLHIQYLQKHYDCTSEDIKIRALINKHKQIKQYTGNEIDNALESINVVNGGIKRSTGGVIEQGRNTNTTVIRSSEGSKVINLTL